jgi:hypothetical protein
VTDVVKKIFAVIFPGVDVATIDDLLTRDLGKLAKDIAGGDR